MRITKRVGGVCALLLVACSSSPPSRNTAEAGAEVSGQGAAAVGGGGGGASMAVDAGALLGNATPIIAPPPAASDDGDDAGPLADNRMAKLPPDPKITFEWPETASGPSHCDAGHFVGTFTCSIEVNSQSVDITGPVELTLTKSQSGEFLEISNGTINGFALLLLNFNAMLDGKLDCSTDQLQASAKDGAVGIGSAALLPVFMFDGDLTGMLDVSGQMLSGNWSFPVTINNMSLGTCVGPWTATRM